MGFLCFHPYTTEMRSYHLWARSWASLELYWFLTVEEDMVPGNRLWPNKKPFSLSSTHCRLCQYSYISEGIGKGSMQTQLTAAKMSSVTHLILVFPLAATFIYTGIQNTSESTVLQFSDVFSRGFCQCSCVRDHISLQSVWHS